MKRINGTSQARKDVCAKVCEQKSLLQWRQVLRFVFGLLSLLSPTSQE